MPKNIVIFSDGTGQDGGAGYNTNVYKLFNMIVDRDDFKQIGFYDRGVGTSTSKFHRLTEGAFGVGISQNILDCYKFIFENYSVGDQIYLFGFSRGATTVRSLSGLLHHFGVLPKSRPELVEQAYDIYKIKDSAERIKKAQEFVGKHHTMWVKIKFLGVWDTVAALGVPQPRWNALINKFPWWKNDFHNLTLSESVEHARHALAIDDQRKVFHPVLWDRKIKSNQTMKQVWFCGMHTDVGGGYREQELSDVPLTWMITEAQRHGLLIYKNHRVALHPDPCGTIHDSRSLGWEKLLYKAESRSWNVQTHGNPVIHESVLSRHEWSANYKPWILTLPYEVERAALAKVSDVG